MADHRATIIKIDGNQVQLEIIDKNPSRQRRFTDRSATFRLDLNFEEERLTKETKDFSRSLIIRTKILVAISPRRDRDRRQSDVTERARQVLTSFRSYLMATKEDETVAPSQGALKAGDADFHPLAGMEVVGRRSGKAEGEPEAGGEPEALARVDGRGTRRRRWTQALAVTKKQGFIRPSPSALIRPHFPLPTANSELE